jgi:hypothetical protein
MMSRVPGSRKGLKKAGPMQPFVNWDAVIGMLGK